MLYRPKLLHDILNELLEPRRTISSRDVQVLFMSRDLHTQKIVSFLLQAQQKQNHHPRSPYARKTTSSDA
jgi:hypothetical protein